MGGSPAGTVLSALTANLPCVRLCEADFGCSFVRQGFLLPLTCPEETWVSFFSLVFQISGFCLCRQDLRKKRAKVRRIKWRKQDEKAKGVGKREAEQLEPRPRKTEQENSPLPSPPLGPWLLPARRSWRDPLQMELPSVTASILLATPVFYAFVAESTTSPLPWGLGCCTNWSPELP